MYISNGAKSYIVTSQRVNECVKTGEDGGGKVAGGSPPSTQGHPRGDSATTTTTTYSTSTTDTKQELSNYSSITSRPSTGVSLQRLLLVLYMAVCFL